MEEIGPDFSTDDLSQAFKRISTVIVILQTAVQLFHGFSSVEHATTVP